MASLSVESLYWLQPTPADFRERIKALRNAEQPKASEIIALSNRALDLNKLTQLGKMLDRAPGEISQDVPLPSVRLAVLADSTTEYIGPAIRATTPRHGIMTEIYLPDFGQTTHDILNPGSALAAFKADIAVLAFDHRSLGLTTNHVDGDEAEAAVAQALARARSLLDGLGRIGISTVLLQNLALPPEPWCGHFDRRAPGSVTRQITAFNEGLVLLADEYAAPLLDVAALADLVGRARWFEHSYWYRAKIPFALDFVPLYADHIGRLIGALRGKARKCLVLDLDNTCWGGVIGDDGLEGVRIGQGTAEGEAFLAIQSYALQLKARGVVLAVCSKNEEDAARLPFQKHPDMALREEDIAVFVANWNDKATNIRHIAKVLNIGTDALAFLDDNPAERERVRQMLPEVAVPELPDDPAYYPAALAQAGYFETIGLSKDDAHRAQQYRANAERTLAMDTIGDYSEYLASLDMVCDLRPFDELGRTRIAQLVNKSNQFNLTTRRYTEAEVARIQDDPEFYTLQVRLTDKFGDNGMISVVIFRKRAEEWTCDTWLMSCRVLGRRVEDAILGVVADAARQEGATRLVGEYIPTAKNRMVSAHFMKMGFEKSSEAADGRTIWQLELADYARPSDLPMKLSGLYLEEVA